MIKTVIFDIGNVLTEFTWKKFIHTSGYSPEVEAKVAHATVENPFWIEYDRGVLSTEEILSNFAACEPEVEKEIRETFADMHGIVEKVDYAIPWIEDLRSRGYQVLVLSNFSEQAHRQCADALDFLEYVDGGILSYQDKVVKPMPEIYQTLIDRYQLLPEECVFIDDMQRNLDGAARFGIHTILFEQEEQARKELETLLQKEA